MRGLIRIRFSLCLVVAAWSGCTNGPELDSTAEEAVGRHDPNRTVTPVNQVLTPYGTQIELPKMRPQAVALSPNGKLLAVSGKTSEVLIVDPRTGRILQHVDLPSADVNEPEPDVVSPNILEPDKKGQLSFTGLIFSPDGARLFLANVNGDVKVFDVEASGKITAAFSIPLPPAAAPRRTNEIPAGLTMSRDGKRLYVALNLSNRLGEFDSVTGKLLRLFDVGVAPYDVVLVGDKAYVSNWGGRRPEAGDLTGPAGRGTTVRVDPVRFIANEGSVSVIDLSAKEATKEILTGLHASALAVHPSGRYVVCANAASDNLSVIDTRTDKVVETIWVKQSPADLFGASPNALAFDAKGKHLYVANGTQNAVAVVEFDPGESKLLGLIPVGWFPGAMAFDAARDQLCVANIKGITPTRRWARNCPGDVASTRISITARFRSCQCPARANWQGSPPSFGKIIGAINWNSRNCRRDRTSRRAPCPSASASRACSSTSFTSSRRTALTIRCWATTSAATAIPSLCIFGERITPNQHKLVRDFVLLDNTYCAGILSADGHQWSTTAFATDYMEKSFAGFPRSYPDGMGEDEADALAYSPGGFIWDNALAHGKTLRNYGEFAEPKVKWRSGKKGTPDFLSCYRTWKGESNLVIFASAPMIESIRPHQPTNYVGWEMNVPDQYRADFIIRELRDYEARGEFPNLTIICLPNDHTSGTSKGAPTPAACVADNDLAFGRIVEALSHSKFWKETVIFAIEDDPQAGWDHVSGYRTTAYCISPYTKRGAVVNTQYNTTSMLRTMEQILGLPPMNQFDATATPMFDCFTNVPDFTPFIALPNNVPLDQMNPDPKKIADPVAAQERGRLREVEFPQSRCLSRRRAEPHSLARHERECGPLSRLGRDGSGR